MLGCAAEHRDLHGARIERRFGSKARIIVPQHCCPLHPNKQTPTGRAQCAAVCRFCCKSLFALVIKISFGLTRDFRVNMWGTSLPEDKLAGDLGNVIEATSIGGRRSDFFTARKLAPGNLGLLQQYLPIADSCTAANSISIRSPRRRARE